MAKAYECDICSELYKKFDNVTVTRSLNLNFFPTVIEHGTQKKMDVCPDCIVSLCKNHIKTIKGVVDESGN